MGGRRTRRKRSGGKLGVIGALALLLVAVASMVAVGGWWLKKSAEREDSASATVDYGDRTAHRGSRAVASRPLDIGAQDPSGGKPTGNFRYATGDGPVLGTGGTRHKFRLAVEEGVPVEVAEFTSLVEGTLGDKRSWIASGTDRFQRVGDANVADFTIYLATPQTAEQLCSSGGVSTIINGVPYTSCRVGPKVVINLDRYQQAVPDYGANLALYRHYVVNHEVGHFIGQNHMACPGPGKLAPVMQQQTLGLTGCVANAWPYVDGKLYVGPPGGQ